MRDIHNIGKKLDLPGRGATRIALYSPTVLNFPHTWQTTHRRDHPLILGEIRIRARRSARTCCGDEQYT